MRPKRITAIASPERVVSSPEVYRSGEYNWLLVGPLTVEGGDSVSGYVLSLSMETPRIVNGTSNCILQGGGHWYVICSDHSYNLTTSSYTPYTNCQSLVLALVRQLSNSDGYRISGCAHLLPRLAAQGTPLCNYGTFDQIPQLVGGCKPVQESSLRGIGGIVSSIAPSVVAMLFALVILPVFAF